MKLVVQINIDTESFGDKDGPDCGIQCARILRNLAGKLEKSDGMTDYFEDIKCVDGHSVGFAMTKDSVD